MQMHFMSGLPRSGSTLLSAILQQNPNVKTSIISPMVSMFNAILRSTSGSEETSNFVTNDDRKRILKAIFSAYYAEHPYSLVLDSNRAWTAKLPALVELFPRCKMICCVREPAWIMESIEKLLRKNPLMLTGLLGYQGGGTVYDRADILAGNDGMLGWPLNALREAYFGPHADRMLIVEYEALVSDPYRVIEEVYKWLDLPLFEHNIKCIEQIPGADVFDARLDTPGLHTVGESVVHEIKRTPTLPPDIFNRFAGPFWRGKKTAAKVVLAR